MLRRPALPGYDLTSPTGRAASIFKQPDNFRRNSALSRRKAPELCMHPSPQVTEGVGNAGCQCTRSLACKSETSTRAWSPKVQPDSPGIPTRNGFNGLFRALPGDEFVLSPSLTN